MKACSRLFVVAFAVSSLGGCVSTGRNNLARDTFPDAQAELGEVIETVYKDCATANLEVLRASHLSSNKFTKFSPRRFQRQNVKQCNVSEGAFFTSIQDAHIDVQELRIDVLGKVAIATFYPHGSFIKDGELVAFSARQTLVFLKTADGWKIVHEHGRPAACFEG